MRSVDSFQNFSHKMRKLRIQIECGECERIGPYVFDPIFHDVASNVAAQINCTINDQLVTYSVAM